MSLNSSRGGGLPEVVQELWYSFCDRVLLFSPGCSGTLYVAQVSLELGPTKCGYDKGEVPHPSPFLLLLAEPLPIIGDPNSTKSTR